MHIDEKIGDLVTRAPGIWQLDACGVTRTARAIPALLHQASSIYSQNRRLEAYLPADQRMQVVLIGGMSGQTEDVALALQALEAYGAGSPQLHRHICLSAVPCANPDGLALAVAPENGAGGNPSVGYPPAGNFFYDPVNPEAHYLWRWLSFLAPDVVLEIRAGEMISWEVSAPVLSCLPQLQAELSASTLALDDSLLGALATGAPNGLPPLPGLRLICPIDQVQTALNKLWAVLAQSSADKRSAVRRVLEARSSRTRLAVARVLSAAYGHKLDPVVYTQGVAISGRLRLANLDAEFPDPTSDIVPLVEPYVTGQDRAHLLRDGQRNNGANLAGLVWAGELTAATGDSRYEDLLVSVANRYLYTHNDRDNGTVPLPSDPDYRVEDMFFSAAILGLAFKLTGDSRYLSVLTRFLLDANVQQTDELFWHARSVPYYWGRGNGFAALGFAETLTYMPDNHPDRSSLLAIHQRHLDALCRYQHPSGMWRQVIDYPGSYLEMSATCMVGYAMARGMRLGWLASDYEIPLLQAWQAVAARIDDDGGLVDVCTGTGVQQSLRDYLDRPAIFGWDERGGALALWFVIEMELLLREFQN